MKSIWNKNWFIVLIATACCLLWGSAFPCIKIGYQLFNIPAASSSAQILFAGTRFALSGVMVILAGSILSQRFLYPNSVKSFLLCLFLSLFQTIGQYVFFYIGLAHTTGSNGAIIEATNTFFTILWACLIFKTEKFSFWKMLGCFVGFSGVCLIELHGTNLSNFEFNFMGDGFVLISCLLASFVPSLLKQFSKTETPFVLSGYQFLLGGIVMVLAAFISGGRIEPPAASVKAYTLLTYLAFISACAYTLWSLLLKSNPVSKVAIFGFINPVFGFLLSAVILGEASTAFSWAGICSLLLVSLGIILVYYKKEEKQTSVNRIMETDRLILREYTMDDFDSLFEIMSDPETMQHYPSPFDEEKTRNWIKWNLENYEKYGFGLWAVVLKETGEFIGDCGITIQNIDGEMLPEIGYHINKKYWRKGYGKEAAMAARDWCFFKTEYDIVYSDMKYTNIASYSTAIANGMKKVKEYADSKNEISYAYAITRDEWKQLWNFSE